MTDETKPLNIYQRIQAVADEIGAFSKDGTNARFNFKYAGIEKIVAELRPICSKHGLLFIQSHKRDGTVVMPDGKLLTLCTVISTAINLDDPKDRHETETPGDGFDTLDKGIYKAISGARKYAIFGMFNLHAGDTDPEYDGGKQPAQRSTAQPQQRQAAPQRKSAAPPKDDPADARKLAKLREILFPNVPWPIMRKGTGEYADKTFPVTVSEKHSEPASQRQIKGILAACSGAGYSKDTHRYALLKTLYFIGEQYEGNVHTRDITKGEAMYILNLLNDIRFVGKNPDDPPPWMKRKVAQQPDPPPPDDDELDPDIDLAEDEDFFVD